MKTSEAIFLIAGLICLQAIITMLWIENTRLSKESRAKTEAIGALGDVIHEVWMQDSTSFNQNIRPTKAFKRADLVLEGDWEDIFFEWKYD